MSCKAKDTSEIDGKAFLQQSFAMRQAMLKTQLEMSSVSITHNGTMGEVNEKHFIGHLYIKVPNATCDLKVA